MERQTTNELNILIDCKNLFVLVDKLCNNFHDFRFTLNPQMVRASISIGSNIAEGNNKSKKEFNRYLDISIGSCNELLYQIELIKSILNHKRRFYITNDDLNEILNLINKIKATCINIKSYNNSLTRKSLNR
jgi:four helix bundle protein